MKTYIASIFCMYIALSTATAQTGVYITAADYRQHHQTYEVACNGRPHNIRLHDFFGHSSNVTVLSGTRKYRLKKNSLYGYSDCAGHAYRFWNNAAYEIADTAGMVIYKTTENIAQTKGFKVVNKFYFSLTLSSEIQRLDYANLEAAYATCDRFLVMLFQCWSEMNPATYDELHGMFRLNYLFNQTIVK